MKKLVALLCIMVALNMLMTFEIGKQTNERLSELESKVETFNVTATMYNAVESQCDSDPLITAAMYKINPKKASEHKWIAMSRDMLKRWGGHFNYGDKVLISGAGHKDGIYIVADTMNKRFKKRIDILETKGTPLYKFNSVTIQKVNS
jgi:3D (Asp-Asp-Asp) domain-containing protein